MSEWQPAMILDVHKETPPSARWAKIIGKVVRVRELPNDPMALRCVREVCPSADKAFEINRDDAERHGYLYPPDHLCVCQCEILTD